MLPSEFDQDAAAKRRQLREAVTGSTEVYRPGIELEVWGHRRLEDVTDWLDDNKLRGNYDDDDDPVGSGDWGAAGEDKWVVKLKVWLTTGAYADLKRAARTFGRIRKTTGLTTLDREGKNPRRENPVQGFRGKP